MTDIDLYVAALKVTWVRRHVMQNQIWQLLFDSEMAHDTFIWERNSRSLQKNGL